MTKNDILLFLSENRQKLKQEYGVLKVGLFGSYSRGEEKENSDIDLIVDLDAKDFFIKEDLREYLENSFHKSVDIGYIDSIREFYKEKIEKDIIYV